MRSMCDKVTWVVKPGWLAKMLDVVFRSVRIVRIRFFRGAVLGSTWKVRAKRRSVVTALTSVAGNTMMSVSVLHTER